jgi:hypothetical protein
MYRFLSYLIGLGISTAVVVPTVGMTFSQSGVPETSMVLRVAEGCGATGWRGPWGHCRDTPFSGRLPDGMFVTNYNGCPPGYWRGPWGNCRNTPFHGRLPDGSYQ